MVVPSKIEVTDFPIGELVSLVRSGSRWDLQVNNTSAVGSVEFWETSHRNWQSAVGLDLLPALVFTLHHPLMTLRPDEPTVEGITCLWEDMPQAVARATDSGYPPHSRLEKDLISQSAPRDCHPTYRGPTTVLYIK